jgi:hypothetical protein
MANSDYKDNGMAAQFTPIATLALGVSFLDRTLNLGAANFPRTDSLKVGMAVLVNDEWMAITAIQGSSVTVNRGCADSVPAEHPIGSLCWFVAVSVVGTDAKEHTAGEINSVKYSPYTTSGRLDTSTSSAIDVVEYRNRYARPYPPGHVLVNGARWYLPHELSADIGALVLTWTHRDRLIEADQLIDHDAGNIGPEDGTSYTARVYDRNMNLRRVYPGILANSRDIYGDAVPAAWSYTWHQAVTDLDVLTSEIGAFTPGFITLHATRDEFDSWQGYVIPISVNSQGYFMKAAQLAQIVGQGLSDADNTNGFPPLSGVFAGQVAAQAAQNLTDAENNASGPTHGVYVASLHQGVGQETNFYTALNRNLFEAPYALLKKRSASIDAKVVTVVARPSDRLTDAHSIWTRYDWPRGHGAVVPFEKRVDPPFTPWLTLGADLDYLADTIVIGKTSFLDGIPLSDVQPGQVALVDAEFIRVDGRDATTITIARGCYDTVPGKHYAGSRVWFIEAGSSNDPTAYPYTLDTYAQLGSAAEVKMVPAVYGPPLNLNDVPTDRVDMAHRVERPYPPGEVLVNGAPWYNGCVIEKDQAVRITWVHRNRDTQAAQALDHHAPGRTPEDNQKYRLTITLNLYDQATKRSYTVTVRQDIVEGTQYDYTYSMATTDGYRAGSLLRVCGRVTVGMTLEAIRGDLASWQSYVIPMALPSYACPPSQPPGGGQLPPNTGGGNGSTGPTPGDQPGPGDNSGDPDPGDNGSGGNGDGPPPPPDTPPDWPDPIDPPPEPDPDDPNPALGGHWDTNWARHWDAYTKDNQGT